MHLYGITHFVSVALANKHFAVLFYDIKDRSVIVHDGLYLPLTTWQFYITHTLRKYGLQQLNYQAHVKTTIANDTDQVLEICSDDLNKPWLVSGNQILKQNDGYNCGPIACLKVLKIYGFLPRNSIAEIAHEKYGYRGVVMDFYKKFLLMHEHDLRFKISKTGALAMKMKRSSAHKMDNGVDEQDSVVDEEDVPCRPGFKQHRGLNSRHKTHKKSTK